MTAEALGFGSEEMRPLVYDGARTIEEISDDARSGLGRMSLERWKRLLDQMNEIELVESGSIAPEDCFSNQFLD
jgi:hypothetical protein